MKEFDSDDIPENMPFDGHSAITVEPKPVDLYLQRYIDGTRSLLNLPEISISLKLPKLDNARPDSITRDQVKAGVKVLIPGSPMMRKEDVIVFHWGAHACSNVLHHESIGHNIVWVLCICYEYIDLQQYGPLELYYEVWRAEELIGTSPFLHVVVEGNGIR